MLAMLLDLIAPDYCYVCQKTGSLLCSSCKYDITSDRFGRCILCLFPVSDDNLCSGCRSPLDRAWTVGERTGTLEQIVNDSKFASNRRACQLQADLLDSLLPKLPSNTVVLPLPTTWRHVRQRGLDHTWVIAKTLAKSRHLTAEPVLMRAKHTVQHGSSRAQRISQAKEAYRCGYELVPDVPYLIVDDVCTTGSSLVSAAKVLRQAGANQVWAAVTTRQLLDV